MSGLLQSWAEERRSSAFCGEWPHDLGPPSIHTLSSPCLTEPGLWGTSLIWTAHEHIKTIIIFTAREEAFIELLPCLLGKLQHRDRKQISSCFWLVARGGGIKRLIVKGDS